MIHFSRETTNENKQFLKWETWIWHYLFRQSFEGYSCQFLFKISLQSL